MRQMFCHPFRHAKQYVVMLTEHETQKQSSQSQQTLTLFEHKGSEGNLLLQNLKQSKLQGTQ